MPKATSEATKAAIASAVPPLSLSTTVRATAAPPARGATVGVDWVGTPDSRELLLAGVALHPDDGADADDVVVHDPLAMG